MQYGDVLTKDLKDGSYWVAGMLLRWSLTTAVLVGLRDYRGFQITTLLIISVAS
jgi:hypothetical protein